MLTKPNPASTTLYSHSQELESHAVRFIMAHKSIEREVIEAKLDEMPEEVLELNPVRRFLRYLTEAWFYTTSLLLWSI